MILSSIKESQESAERGSLDTGRSVNDEQDSGIFCGVDTKYAKDHDCCGIGARIGAVVSLGFGLIIGSSTAGGLAGAQALACGGNTVGQAIAISGVTLAGALAGAFLTLPVTIPLGLGLAGCGIEFFRRTKAHTELRRPLLSDPWGSDATIAAPISAQPRAIAPRHVPKSVTIIALQEEPRATRLQPKLVFDPQTDSETTL